MFAAATTTAQSPGSPTAEIRSAVLPTGQLIGAAIAGSGLTGALWWAIASVLGARAEWTHAGLLAAAIVGGSAVLAVLAIRPWKRRSLMKWPFVWMAGSALRLVCVLILTGAVYFALSLETPALALAMLAAYFATMWGEIWIYKRGMTYLPPLTEDNGQPNPE